MPDQKQVTVVKANSLIQAGYRLTLAEQRILLTAISQICSGDAPTDQNTYSVDVNALASMRDTTTRRAYQELAEATKRLYDRSVRIEKGPNGEALGPEDRNGKRKRVTMARWVQDVEYIEAEGRVELRFSHAILPYLSLLQKEFTKYELRYVASMRSTYGIRLYELIQQWRSAGERVIDLDELRYLFGIVGQYSAIKDLKHRVIDPAVRDVNEYSDLTVTYEQYRSGRRIAGFRFLFAEKSGKDLKALPAHTRSSQDGDRQRGSQTQAKSSAKEQPPAPNSRKADSHPVDEPGSETSENTASQTQGMTEWTEWQKAQFRKLRENR